MKEQVMGQKSSLLTGTECSLAFYSLHFHGCKKGLQLIVDVMVNFMCQLGLVTVSRYLVRQQSGCCCEGILLHELNI